MSDIHAYRQGSSTIAAVGSRYYAAGMIDNAADAGTSPYKVASHVLYAMPYFSGHAHIVDRIAVYVQVGASGARGQLGIYTVNCAQNFFPQSLMLSGSECDFSATGLQQLMIQCCFRPDTLYWFALLSNGNPQLVRVAVPFPIFGWDPSTATIPRPFITMSYGYGLLPNPFPTTVGCTTSVSGTPCVAVRPYQ
jgi:hypothetical protein